MTRPGIETRSSELLVNTLPIWPMSQLWVDFLNVGISKREKLTYYEREEIMTKKQTNKEIITFYSIWIFCARQIESFPVFFFLFVDRL